MDDISEEAHLSKGALYWYFKSKDAIIEALLERIFELDFPDQVVGKTVRAVTAPVLVEVRPDQSLQEALEKFSDSSVSWAPVVEGKKVVGRLTARNIMRVYKSTLQRSVSRVRALTDNTVMFEAKVGTGPVLTDMTLRQINWPPNTLVVSINRGGEAIFPRADTRLQAGDRVMVMADPSSEQALRTFLEGAQPAESAQTGAAPQLREEG